MSLRELPGRILWNLPLSFGLARLMGPGYELRCVLFHHVSDHPSPFTDGMEVRLSADEFEARIRFLAEHYSPVALDRVLDTRSKLPPRPVLVTFDDAYASVARMAAPICRKYGVPAVFFVNASLVGNQELALDNLIYYVANLHGMAPINRAAHRVAPDTQWELTSTKKIFSEFLPTLPLAARNEFRAALAEVCGVDTKELARDARLYVTLDDLQGLLASGFEIASHTYSHVHCRVLTAEDFALEIDNNKQTLEGMLGRPVRAFSVPYGSSDDLTPALSAYLRRTGHEAVFLMESRANTDRTALQRLYRVSLRTGSDAEFFNALEVRPRYLALKDQLVGRSPGVRPQKL